MSRHFFTIRGPDHEDDDWLGMALRMTPRHSITPFASLENSRLRQKKLAPQLHGGSFHYLPSLTSPPTAT